MRYQLLVLLVSLVGGSCAGHRTPAPMPIERYVFIEDLPDHVQICVRRDIFRAELACLPLGEFRHMMRHLKRASIEKPIADEEQVPQPARDLVPREPAQR
jgi:hypothetical protein